MAELTPKDEAKRLGTPPLQGRGRGWGVDAERLGRLHGFAREMRTQATEPEKRLWYRVLSRAQLGGFKFRRQAVIGPFIADFLCPQKALIVEVDGWTHDDFSVDERRDAALRELGFTVVRFTNGDVMQNIEGVAAAILDALHRASDRWQTPNPNPSPEGEGLEAVEAQKLLGISLGGECRMRRMRGSSTSIRSGGRVLLLSICTLAACQQPEQGGGSSSKAEQLRDVEPAAAAKHEEQERALREACSDGVELVAALDRKSSEMISAIENAHQPRIEEAERAYQGTIGNPIYEMSGEGVVAALELEEKVRDAKIAGLTEKRDVLEAFLPLETELDTADQELRVAEASGRTVSTEVLCERSRALITSAVRTLSAARKASPSVDRIADAEEEVIKAAQTRIDKLTPEKRTNA